MTRATISAGPWFTDGLVVWARSAAGPAICAARNLEPSEGTFAPVSDVAERMRNMVAIAALPDLVEALNTVRFGYVLTLEKGRDRILELGGTCDPVEVMTRGDPYLKKIDAALALLTNPRERP